MKKSNSKVLGFTALAAAAGALTYFFTRKKEVSENVVVPQKNSAGTPVVSINKGVVRPRMNSKPRPKAAAVVVSTGANGEVLHNGKEVSSEMLDRATNVSSGVANNALSAGASLANSAINTGVDTLSNIKITKVKTPKNAKPKPVKAKNVKVKTKTPKAAKAPKAPKAPKVPKAPKAPKLAKMKTTQVRM